ncbi:GGDEF domain-containing protein [Vibrio sp. SM6]|uniref:diguanylate cyclase n=1 Tax=Vibrio agarilyticus TaxID=2726741 RepID=A0A7X8TN15_9VIBR|nr:GGDEF domain-containing protein [Vibrio agarilyticus]NLS11763.1 GGDEF domain-containing protein [Vibrio agarilyticus]
MENLLNKLHAAGLDHTRVSGEDAITLWRHVGEHLASTPMQRAYCLIISAEYRFELNQVQLSIDELKQALDILELPQHAAEILAVKNSLCERLGELGDYHSALNEYVSATTIAVEHSYIDQYVTAVIGLGNLCDTYGDHARALRYYQKIDSIDLAITSRTLRLRYKLYMLACFIKLQRLNPAQDLLTECEELSILVSDKSLTGQILLYQAKLHRLRDEHDAALKALAKAQYSASTNHASWLALMNRIEVAYTLSAIGKQPLAVLLLMSKLKKVESHGSPVLSKQFYDALSHVLASQAHFKTALEFEKKAYAIESELMKQVPITELGAAQLRRLTRFELQLKLIMSEIENKELKETTKQHKSTVAQLQQDVLTDPLTSLKNRRWLDAKLKELLLSNTPFALLVIDIDHFKSINDELSHLVGDKAIVNVSHELIEQFRRRDASCVRFGGEEFLVIVENVTLQEAQQLAEDYRKRIYQFNWQPILGERSLTVSIGVTLHHAGENTQRTFHRADKALYRAKALGRNQTCCEE